MIDYGVEQCTAKTLAAMGRIDGKLGEPQHVIDAQGGGIAGRVVTGGCDPGVLAGETRGKGGSVLRFGTHERRIPGGEQPVGTPFQRPQCIDVIGTDAAQGVLAGKAGATYQAGSSTPASPMSAMMASAAAAGSSARATVRPTTMCEAPASIALRGVITRFWSP